MATLSLTIPDASLPRIQDAFASDPAFVDSGLTKSQFVKVSIISHIRQVVKQYEASVQVPQTNATIEASVNSINIT